MRLPAIKRRRFLSSLLLLLVFARCKKDTATPANSAIRLPPANEDDPLGLYSITEVGPKLQVDLTFNTTVNGYTDQLSYNPGDTLTLHLSSPETIKNAVLGMNDSQGKAALSITSTISFQKIKSDKPWVEGFKYDPTITVKLPEDLKSGIYTWPGDVPFVVKGKSSSYDLTVVYPSNTLNAYNYSGGKSLYAPDFYNRSTVLSYLRSNTLSYGQFYKWLDTQIYNINYIADSDLDDYNQINNSKAVIVTGHSEYWSKQARLNVDAFIATGRNVLMLAGNNMWWQVRYNKAQNLMICYKDVDGTDTKASTQDPLGGTEYSTVNWGAPVVDYSIVSSLGADYRGGGYGNVLPNRWNGYKIVQQNSPLFKGTGLNNGDILTIPTREYDCAPVVKLFPYAATAPAPVIDMAKLGFYKAELLGFDYAQNLIRRDRLGFGTFIVCQKTPTSGIVVNTATMDWCSTGMTSADSDKVAAISKNMIDLSLAGYSLFTS